MKYRYFMLPFIIIFFMILVIDYNSEIVNKVLIDSNRTINYPFFDNDNIDLFIEAEYLPEDVTKEEDALDEKVETEEIEEVRVEKIKVDDVKDDIPVVDEKKEETMEKINTEEIKEETRENDNITASDLFSNLDDSETYTTYYVYIVKEEDTIDKIISLYGVTKEDIENYNDITSIKPGDKVIIPKTSE